MCNQFISRKLNTGSILKIFTNDLNYSLKVSTKMVKNLFFNTLFVNSNFD